MNTRQKLRLETSRKRTAFVELDDLSLLRAKRHEEAASRLLFRHYQGLVFSYLWRMLGYRASHSLIEDLTQETFLRVFRGLERFSPKGVAKLSSWILTIATRVALNELRRKTKDMILLDETRLQSKEKADEYTNRRVLGERLQYEISQLAPPFRAVFLLREYHERSYEEIAQILTIEVGTVKSRLARSREMLRKALKEVHDA